MIGLTVLVGGVLAWAVAPLGAAARRGPAWLQERRAWRALLAPLVVITMGSAIWIGWALQEPETSDERLAVLDWVVATLVLALWARALVRFVRATAGRPATPISVVGLFSPRIVVDARFQRALDQDAFAAALAHEAAHVRHRDPLRIALAQLSTDLQWPWPQPRERLAAWQRLLEDTRDDEAVLGGAHPEDLAAAIVEAAQWTARGAGASLTDHPIEHRIRRLLDGCARMPVPGSRTFAAAFAAVFAAVFASLVIGITVGDDLLALLPGVLR